MGAVRTTKFRKSVIQTFWFSGKIFIDKEKSRRRYLRRWQGEPH